MVIGMKIAVYCGSGSGNNPNFITKTKELGQWFSKYQHTLIFGGGNEGLMGIIAKEAYTGGCEVIGVLPKDIPFIRSRKQPYCTKVLEEANMNARKQKMLELADVFIALPGGIGTLDEISEVITLSKIGKIDKKCICYNIDGFYDPFKLFLQEMVQCGFLKEKDMELVLFLDTIEEVEKSLSNS